jgi:hypothetical protein
MGRLYLRRFGYPRALAFKSLKSVGHFVAHALDCTDLPVRAARRRVTLSADRFVMYMTVMVPRWVL